MNRRYFHNIFALFVTFLVASLLTIIPLDGSLAGLRPHWILLTVLYWVLVWPLHIGVGWAFLLGLFTDLLVGTLLGQHALAFCLAVYLLSGGYHRMRMYSVWQQVPIVLFLMVVSQLVFMVVCRLLGDTLSWYQALVSALSSAIVWPAWCVWLNLFKMRFVTID